MGKELNTKNIEEIYLFPVDFFSAPNFLERYKQQIELFKRTIRVEEKEKVKNSLNAFYIACINSQQDENVKLEIHLLFFGTLNIYAQHYNSAETYRNIIKAFETKELKDKLFSKFPINAKMAYAETLFFYYNLIKHEEPLFSFEKIDLIIKAKSYLWKLYIHHIEKKNVLNKADLSHCLTLLSGSLTELSRWVEPLHYLNEAKSYLLNNPNIEYTRALLLDAIKQKTCLSFNGQLILKIIDSCMEASKFPNIMKEQKQQLKEIEKECRTFLSQQKPTIKILRNHKYKTTKIFNNYNPYKKFCAVNQLFLNEHSFFCNCDRSTRDDLQIQTNHNHTKIEWTKQFEIQIDILVHDFIVARHNYYYSLDNNKITSFRGNSTKRNNSNDGIKNALLKNSFKTFYSLLDQIAHGIFHVLDIDYESKLKEQFTKDQGIPPKLYFLNMWDFKLFDEKHFADNFYLISLYSIAQDLNRSKYAALKEFKTIRNAMEHKILHITQEANTTSRFFSDDSVCTKEELVEKTKILMMLTKSAIYSFTYLIRKQSKYKEKESVNVQKPS